MLGWNAFFIDENLWLNNLQCLILIFFAYEYLMPGRHISAIVVTARYGTHASVYLGTVPDTRCAQPVLD
jgi:hypothetical protein